MTARVILVCIGTALLLPAVAARATSSAGIVVYAANHGAITIPAGTSLTNLSPAVGQVPADAYPTLSMVYRGVVYATAGAATTTLTVGLYETSISSAAVTIPANSTVSILLETVLPVTAGASLYGALTLTAGQGGSVTIQPGTSVTLEVMPSNVAAESSCYVSR